MYGTTMKFLKVCFMKAHEAAHLPSSLLTVHKLHHPTTMHITISLWLRQLLSSSWCLYLSEIVESAKTFVQNCTKYRQVL